MTSIPGLADISESLLANCVHWSLQANSKEHGQLHMYKKGHGWKQVPHVTLYQSNMTDSSLDSHWKKVC